MADQRDRLGAALAGRYARQDDLLLGVPVSNRRHAETEDVVGCFVNTLPLRVRLDGGDPTDDCTLLVLRV